MYCCIYNYYKTFSLKALHLAPLPTQLGLLCFCNELASLPQFILSDPSLKSSCIEKMHNVMQLKHASYSSHALMQCVHEWLLMEYNITALY